MLYRILWFVCACLFLTLLSGCSDKRSEQFRIGVNNWIGYSPLYLSPIFNDAAKQSYQVIPFGSNTDIMLSLRSNVLEAAGLTLDEAITLANEGIELDVVMVFDVSNGGDAIITHNRLESLTQLAGKTIAVEETAVGALMLSSALKEANLTRDDVNIQYCAFNQHEECYEKSDALVTFEPILTKLRSKGAKEIFSSRQIPNKIVDVLVVRRDLHPNKKHIIKEIIRSYFATLKRIHDKESQLFEEISLFTHLTPQEVIQAFDGIQMLTLSQNINMLDKVLFNQFTVMYDFMIEHELIKKQSYSPLIVNSDYLRDAQ